MQQIPIGISEFDELRTNDYFFVDKSMLCADVVHSGAKVILFPRPRRFGKTLNMSMLRCFFSDSVDGPALFEGLAVTDHKDVMAHCGAYPTVFLTLKDIKEPTFEESLSAIGSVLMNAYLAHLPLIKDTAQFAERDRLERILYEKASKTDYQQALALLTGLLHRATGKKVVLLLDEYDMPIHAAFNNGYYEEMIGFMRNLLSGAFKDNPHLEKGVLTGIMRIAKESIFSGVNNLDVFTLLDKAYSGHFGFTETEVMNILRDTGQVHRLEEVKAWYNGYRAGNHTMYNPWSIMKCASRPDEDLQSHWVNTSDNQLVRELVTGTRVSYYKESLQTLLHGDTIHEKLDTNIILTNLTTRSFWSMLTFSGYLTPRKLEIIDGKHHCDLALPNREVHSFFEEMIMDWISLQTGTPQLTPMLSALLEGNFDFFAHLFGEAVRHTLSYHDTAGNPEWVYHVFLLGMLIDLKRSHHIRSNRESGYGRYDIMVIPKEPGHPGYVFEFKQCDHDPQAMAKQALDQIRQREYAAELQAAGADPIHAVGVAFSGKQVALEIGEFNPEP